VKKIGILAFDDKNGEGVYKYTQFSVDALKINKPKCYLTQKIVRLIQFLFFIKQEFEIFKDINIFLSPAISVYPHFYLNRPFIFTLYDMQERYYPKFFSRFENFRRWLNNRTLTKSSFKIICESSFVKKDIIKFTNTDSNKISIIQSPPIVIKDIKAYTVVMGNSTVKIKDLNQ
jgi:hypothetical protein